jgi:hypothetical protein
MEDQRKRRTTDFRGQGGLPRSCGRYFETAWERPSRRNRDERRGHGRVTSRLGLHRWRPVQRGGVHDEDHQTEEDARRVEGHRRDHHHEEASGAKGDETRVAKAAAKKAAKTAKEAKPAKKAAKAKPAKAAAKTNGAAKQSRSPKNPSSHPVLAAFKAREGTNRAKLLLCLSKHIDKKVALTKVEQAVYGVVDHGQGKLAMVILGAQKSIKKDQLPYAIDIGRDEKKERFIELRSA